MKLLRPTATALLSCLFFIGMAQSPQPPQWSEEIPEFDKTATFHNGSSCAAQVVYGAFTHFKPLTRLVKLSPDGQVETRVAALPHTKKHDAFNAFALIGGRPCVVYNEWDKKTGVLTLSLQPYSPALEPEGAPVALGTIPLNPKTYYGTPIWLSTARSADRSKTLFYFDEIQQGNIKLGMYWVVDENLELLWSGAYRIPVVALGSETSTWVANNGHVYVRVTAVGLEDVKVKDKKDGTQALRTQVVPWRNRSTAWYEMFGETFNKWAPDTEDGEVHWNLGFANHGNTNILASLRTSGSKKDITHEWIVLRLEDGLRPVLLGQGPATNAPGEMAYKPNAMTDGAGNVYVSALFEQGTYLSRIEQGSTAAWGKMLAWKHPEFYLFKDQALSMGRIPKDRMEEVLDGVPFNALWPARTAEGLMAIVVGPDGQDKRLTLMSPDEHRHNPSYLIDTELLTDCGHYINLSNKRKCFVTMKLD